MLWYLVLQCFPTSGCTAFSWMRRLQTWLRHLIILSLGFSLLRWKKQRIVRSLWGSCPLGEAMAHSSKRVLCFTLFFWRWLFRKVTFQEITANVQVWGDRPCTDCGFLCSRTDVCVLKVTPMVFSDFPAKRPSLEPQILVICSAKWSKPGHLSGVEKIVFRF